MCTSYQPQNFSHVLLSSFSPFVLNLSFSFYPSLPPLFTRPIVIALAPSPTLSLSPSDNSILLRFHSSITLSLGQSLSLTSSHSLYTVLPFHNPQSTCSSSASSSSIFQLSFFSINLRYHILSDPFSIFLSFAPSLNLLPKWVLRLTMEQLFFFLGLLYDTLIKMADEQNTHESGMIDSRTGVESWPCGNPAPLHPSHPLAWTWFSCLKETPSSLPVMEKGDCFEYSHFYFWLCEHEATCTAVSGRQTCMFHANISTTVYQNIFSVRLILKKKHEMKLKTFTVPLSLYIHWE